MQQFKSQHLGVARKCRTKGSAVVRLAAKKKLVARSLQLRRKYAGFLLDTIKLKSIQLKIRDDFGKGCHTQTTKALLL